MNSKIDAFAFCAPDLRLWGPRMEERIREKTSFLREFPSPPSRNSLPVRVYLSK
jgi:hypothetical protein